ncbi:MAG: class I adenylate-forming enzyme family protein [Desulfoprunum sp.]
MSTMADLARDVARLITEMPVAGRSFSVGDASVTEVYAMGAWLRARLAGRADGAVCLAAEDRAVIAAALLASLAGGPVLLLPFAFSAQALVAMHKATGFAVVITDVHRDLPPGVEVVCPRRGDSGPEMHRQAIAPREEILRLYTGGSTGVPQIWPKTGINLFAEALFLTRHFGVSSTDRIVATISPYHIYGLLYSVLLPLVSGASVAPGMPSYPDEIVHAVRERQASILVSVPAHYRILRDRSAMGPSLRLAFSSAGILDPDDNRDFYRHNPAGIVEIYGSTETGGIALRRRSRGEEQFTPYPTIAWRIEAERLHIRSPYLSPNLPLQADGYFVTGDRVEAADGGGFHLRGRADSITKVAGKRVDLEEIAALIRRQPGVTDCLVMALDDDGGREHRIVAVVEGGDVEIEALRRELAGHLEPYALPRAIRLVDRLPLRDNGKYDRPAILRLLAP